MGADPGAGCIAAGVGSESRRSAVIRRMLLAVGPAVSEGERRAYLACMALIWLSIPLLGGIGAVSMLLLGIGLGFGSVSAMTFPILIAPVAAHFTLRRFDILISSISGAFAFAGFVGPLVVIFTYVTTGWGGSLPLSDPWLARADAVLGFDWNRLLAATDALAAGHPWVDRLLKDAYASIVPQFVSVILILSISGQYARLQAFLIAYLISVVACGLISSFIPAVGAYEFYGINEAMHPNLRLTTMNVHLAEYVSLRDGSFSTFSITQAKGIITFPSYHSTIAFLFAWAVWRTPYVRWAGLLINAVMVAATPFYGSHYLVDVLAGLALAPPSFLLACWVRERAVHWLAPLWRKGRQGAMA